MSASTARGAAAGASRSCGSRRRWRCASTGPPPCTGPRAATPRPQRRCCWPAPAAAAGTQHAAPRASLPRHLAAVALRLCGAGNREPASWGGPPPRSGLPAPRLSGRRLPGATRSSTLPAPADPALSHFAGATTVSAMSGEPRWGAGSAQCRHATGCCSCVCVCPSTRQQRHTWATVRDVDRPPQKLDGESKARR